MARQRGGRKCGHTTVAREVWGSVGATVGGEGAPQAPTGTGEMCPIAKCLVLRLTQCYGAMLGP